MSNPIVKRRMPCHKKVKGGKRCARRKKTFRQDGKKYYMTKSGKVRLKGNKKAPRIRR